jgi:hypothetical protein
VSEDPSESLIKLWPQKPGNDPTGSEKSKEEEVSLVERTGIFDVAKHYAT